MSTSENINYDVIIDSPGRINLIGEHIDYNGGYVLPAAVDKKITLMFKKNGSEICTVHSKNFNSSFTIDLNNLNKSETEWHNYIVGVLYYINELKPNRIRGFDCTLESTLPSGSGMSSSAALECGIAKGLNELFELGLSDIEIIKLSRDAEHNFVGTKCGIMDQFSVVKGKKNHLLLLNCDTLKYELIKADFSPYSLVLLNTNISHNLASSAYNVRRAECQQALEVIQKEHQCVQNLTELKPKVVKAFKNVLPETIYNRALYVAKENKRTLKAVKFLQNNNLNKLGRCLYKSHKGLRKRYEVSCKELDFLVDFTKDLSYVLGARMMGGGFGGCTINLVHENHVEEFIANSSKAYKEKFTIELTPILIRIDDGVRRVAM